MANLDKAKAKAQSRIDKLIAQGGDMPMPDETGGMDAMGAMGDPLKGGPMTDSMAPDGGIAPGLPTATDDAESGYVEVAGGPTCGNCNYLEGTMCTNPKVNKDVSPEDGCCNYWDDGSGQPGIHTA